MIEKCFDEGIIQAFLDGELASDLLENVARHVAVCSDCATQLAEAEEESVFAFSTLEQEFSTLVPTQRLWTKINDSIGKERKSLWQTVFAFFKNPTVAAFASLLVIFGLFMAVLSLQKSEPVKTVAQNDSTQQKVITPIFTPEIASQPLPKVDSDKSQMSDALKNNKKDFQIVKIDFAKKEINPKIENRPTKIQPDVDGAKDKGQKTNGNYLIGEESYLKTIATLETTVNSRKDEILRPSSRFAFEKDLAVVDDAIKIMKAEVKKNPKNEAAKDMLRTSYQNKIDLLNSVTEKTELMASLKQ